jgi:hypothetical protein
MGAFGASGPGTTVSIAAQSVACFESVAMVKRGKTEKWAARSERLSAALRENLKRRKTQARGRADESDTGGDCSAGSAKIEPEAPDFRRNQGWKSGEGSGGPGR